jgi:hypothetical protein
VAIENARLYEAGLLTRSRRERLQIVTDLALAHAELSDLLHLDVSGAAPPLCADDSRLTQVVDNLLSNAVKFTPEEGDVFVAVVTTDETAHLEVRDTGVGIPEDEAQRLFERFFRASTAQNIQGTGLGLSIAKAIVEAHDGTIAFQSSVGVGTTFTVDLPVTEPAALDDPAEKITT